MLTPDQEGIAQHHEIMDELGCKDDWRRIASFDGEGTGPIHTDLTDEQQETLLKAVRVGYYNIPRDATMKELADILGISRQALSERFRRAYKRLIETEFVVDDADYW